VKLNSLGGGSLVTVTGSDFVDSDKLLCRFGTRIVASSFVDSSHTLCVSPPNDVGPVTVYITNNNADFTTYLVTFIYQSMLDTLLKQCSLRP